MQLDDKLCKLFYKETGKVIDDIRDPYRNDYVKWLESKFNNGVLDEMIEYIEETDQQIEWEWGSCRSLQEVKDDNDMPNIYYKLIALKNGG